MQKTVIFTICFILAACNQQPPPKKAGKAATLTSHASDDSFASDSFVTTDSSMSQDDPQVMAEIQRSQNFIGTIGKIGKPTEMAFIRADNFYKCAGALSHAYYLIDPKVTTNNSYATYASKLKESFFMISKDIKLDKVGQFDALTAAVDASNTLFVFFATNSQRTISYSWHNVNDNTWKPPMTFVSGDIKGLPTASFDTKTQKIIVKIFNLGDQKLYTYTQEDSSTFQKQGDPSPSSQEAFDKLQLANGSSLETNSHVILNSIQKPQEASLSIGTRIYQDVFTIGGAEIANAFHKEEELAMTTALKDIQSKACSATP
jgi:hypothetical protein